MVSQSLHMRTDTSEKPHGITVDHQTQPTATTTLVGTNMTTGILCASEISTSVHLEQHGTLVEPIALAIISMAGISVAVKVRTVGSRVEATTPLVGATPTAIPNTTAAKPSLYANQASLCQLSPRVTSRTMARTTQRGKFGVATVL